MLVLGSDGTFSDRLVHARVYCWNDAPSNAPAGCVVLADGPAIISMYACELCQTI